MIFLDANIFLRYLVQPITPAQHSMAEITRTLFEAVEGGNQVVTTSEVVLHEVIFVLASKKHYNLAPDDIATKIGTILRLKGFRLPRGEKRLYLRALELYATYSSLGFADAVVAARVERAGIPLATFDADFDAIPSVVRWQPTGDLEP